MSDRRIGVIGSGGRGALARYAHRPGRGFRVVGCCDVEETVFALNREWYGKDIFVTRDYRKLIEQDLDAVFICSPDYLHEEHALAALERGLAVYLEKPMAITIEGCDRLIVKAREGRGRLFPGHNMRFMSVFKKMKELVARGAIGEIKSVWCRHFVSYGGDAYFR
ncbi:MAG: Gfo/Idh/MocA family oxidoreductase, partial [Kiritimatiellae bacterium]|nr:Gfo/Idh/MocA family oxidoreductase [Kiritimatiellia bacterium]